jgi:hypothetical protein
MVGFVEFLEFVFRRIFQKKTCRKLDLFPSSGEKGGDTPNSWIGWTTVIYVSRSGTEISYCILYTVQGDAFLSKENQTFFAILNMSFSSKSCKQEEVVNIVLLRNNEFKI